MEIIGLSGYARSGKDETAKILIEEYGFTRVAFADKLREVLYQLNPLLTMWQEFSPTHRDAVNVKANRVQDVIDTYGWDGYKSTIYNHEIRGLLQRLGTEAGRQTLGDTIWIDAALDGHGDDAKLVITDCRFPNEAQAIEARGGEVWRIERPGVFPANKHPSETSLNDWSFSKVIRNSSTLEELKRTVVNAYAYKDLI